jgi:tRNA A37 methylthiotransferase MiaB
VSPSKENQPPGERTVSLVTLGCARNEVDSEELAGRLDAAGWTLASGEDAGEAKVVLVNTCGFIEAAKQESIAELLGAASGDARVVAVGCLAERYGSQLAEALPEAQILSFDDYGDIAARLDAVLAGERLPAHEPRDRRRLLPLAHARDELFRNAMHVCRIVVELELELADRGLQCRGLRLQRLVLALHRSDPAIESVTTSG